MTISFEPKPDITELEDWRLAGPCRPYIDKSGDNLCISVKSVYQTPGEQAVGTTIIAQENRFDAARRDATERLLRFYGKSLDDEYKDSLYGISYVADYFVSYKSCANMRVLIKVNKEFFDEIPDDAAPYSIQKPADGYLSAFLSVRDYRKQIEFVTRRLKEHLPDMIKSDYYITNVNIVNEINRLRAIADDIERYFALNGISSAPPKSISCPPQHEDVFEIGFDYNYNPIFALIENCQHIIGYECFLESPLLNHATTANYLINIASMYYELQNSQSIDPSKFFDIFSFYERYTHPRTIASAKSMPSDGMPTYDDNGESFGLADLAKILSSQLSINLCKTEEEKQNEDRRLMDPATRLQIALAADQGRQLVSDFKLSSKGAQDLKKRMADIKTVFAPGENNGQGPLDMVYNDVLAKLNLGCVLEETLQCYLERLVTLTGEAVFDDPDLTKVVNPSATFGSRLGLKCDDKGCDGTIDIDFRVGLPVFQGITIPSNFPTTDFLASTMENALEQLYMALVNALTSLILGTIQNSCEFLFTDVLGEGVASATIKDGFKNWLGNTIGVPADSLGDDEAWKDAVMSKGGSGFMGIVGNTVANMGEAFESAYSGTGISLNVPKDGEIEEVFFTPEAITTFFKEFKDVTEDAEVVLNEQELRGVYAGTASYETIELVYSCATQRNPKFASLFKDPYELADLFSALGKLVNSRFLSEPLPVSTSVPSDMCDLGDGSDAAILRTYLLQQKDNNITQNEINAIFDKEKQRAKQKVLQSLELLNRYNNGGSISAFPNIFGTKDSLIPETPAILSETMAIAAAGSFGGVLDNFNAGTEFYPEAWAYILERSETDGRTEEYDNVEYLTKNPINIWEGSANPSFQFLDNAYDFYQFSLKSYENLYNFGSVSGGDPNAIYSVVSEWGFDYIWKRGALFTTPHYNNLESGERGEVRKKLEPILESIVNEYDQDKDSVRLGTTGVELTVQGVEEIAEFILGWYEKADENSDWDPTGGGTWPNRYPTYDSDRYFFQGNFSWAPEMAWYLSFSLEKSLIQFQVRLYQDSASKEQYVPNMINDYLTGGLEISAESLFTEATAQPILQIARQEPRFISTKPFYGGGSDIRSAFPTYIGQDALAPTTKRDVTSVSYVQQKSYINTSPTNLGITGFYDTQPASFATASFDYDNKYPEGYTESGLLGSITGFATDDYSDSAGFLGRMVKNELSKYFTSDSITDITDEISTNVYYDIVNQFLMQIKSTIINGKYWQQGTLEEGSTAYDVSRNEAERAEAVAQANIAKEISNNIAKISLLYPNTDALSYEEFQANSVSFSQKLIPLSFDDRYCDDLNPYQQAQLIYAIKMFIRLAIVEHVMASLQVCTSFELGWMQGEMFVATMLSEIKEKINDYQIAFANTLENNLWNDITKNATIYYEIKYALGESEKKTYANDENAFKALVREEAAILEDSLVDAFNLGWRSNKWDGFLRRQMFLQFDAPPSADDADPGSGIDVGNRQEAQSEYLQGSTTDETSSTDGLYRNVAENGSFSMPDFETSKNWEAITNAAEEWLNSSDSFGTNIVPITIRDKILETFQGIVIGSWGDIDELTTSQPATLASFSFDQSTNGGDIAWSVNTTVQYDVYAKEWYLSSREVPTGTITAEGMETREVTGIDTSKGINGAARIRIRFKLKVSIEPEYSDSYKEETGTSGEGILSCLEASSTGIGTSIQADLPISRGGDTDTFSTFEHGGGLMFETYVKYKLKGASDYNIIGVNDFIEGFNDIEESDILSDIYDYVNFGIRLCLITSVSGAWTESAGIRAAISSLNNIDDISEREKAFIMTNQARTINGESNTYAYISIPLAFAECEYALDSSVTDAQTEFANGEYEDNIYQKLADTLTETEEYQIIMENIFPIKDMIAMFSLYEFCAMTNAATIRPIPNDFDMFKMLDSARLSTLQLFAAHMYGSDPFI